MKKRICMTLMMAATLFALRAETKEEMTLNDCLLYAREHAYVNRISRVRNNIADADVRLSAASLMPYFDFYTSGNISFGRNIDPETNTYDTRKTVSNSYGLSMSLPVFNGLVNINNLKVAKVASSRQRIAAQEQEDKISIEVIKAFYNVAYSLSIVEQMKMQLSRDSLLLAQVNREFELGTKSGADVAELKAVVASDEFELTSQQNNLEKAYQTLKGNMGMPLDAEYPLLRYDEELKIMETGNETRRVAAARLALRESKLRVRIAKGGFSPTISLSGGFSTSFYKLLGEKNTSFSFGRQLRDNMGEYIGVSLSFPLFTGMSRINTLKKAKLNELESRLELEQATYETEREIEDALLDVKAADREYEAALKRLEAEEQAYRAIRRKFELGDASAIDLFTSGASLATARAGKTGKEIQKIISEILLCYYRGAKLISESQD